MLHIPSKEERRAQRLKNCKHFTGLIYEVCASGVEYDSVKNRFEPPHRWPCFYDGADLPCVRREYPTSEELDREDDELSEMMGRILRARKAITEHTGGRRRVDGSIKCPICEDGRLDFSVAINGHVWAQCSTHHCVQWVE